MVTDPAPAVGAGHAPPELTPTQQEMDARDWTFGGTWPYGARWLFTDGIRLHYVDEGPREGRPVVLLHGNPTWAYLYRNFIPPLVEAGYRAVAHDHLGFGRSDKPQGAGEYSVQRHARHFAALMEELDLDGVTLVLQDWGGPLGLDWAVRNPERVRRLVLLNTWSGGIPAVRFPLPFKLLFAPGTGELLVKGMHVFVRVFLFKGGTRSLDESAKAAYLAPHPSWESRTGVLAYPRLIPRSEKHPSYEVGRHIEANLGRLADKPVLVCWPTKDPAFQEPVLAQWRERFPEAEVHQLEAGHFIQEDAHEQVVPLLLDFLARTS